MRLFSKKLSLQLGAMALVMLVWLGANRPSEAQPSEATPPQLTPGAHQNAPLLTPEAQRKLWQEGRTEMSLMAFQDALQTKVSVSVRNGSTEDIVKEVRASGLAVPVEVRQVPLTFITLEVKDVTALSALTAAALFSHCELCALKDHLLITPKSLRTPQEAAYTDQTIEIKNQQLDVLLKLLIAELDQLGRGKLSFGELSPALQPIVQRVADLQMDLGKGPRIRLTPDTLINYEPGQEDKLYNFVLGIHARSQGVGMKIKSVRRAPRSQP